jgi:hypothetical protein
MQNEEELEANFFYKGAVTEYDSYLPANVGSHPTTSSEEGSYCIRFGPEFPRPQM